MLKTEEVEVIKEQVVDVFCNRCGKSTRDSMDMNYEQATIRASWGYASRKDMENHLSHLCEKCYDDMIKDWKYPPCLDDSY